MVFLLLENYCSFSLFEPNKSRCFCGDFDAVAAVVVDYAAVDAAWDEKTMARCELKACLICEM